MLEDVLTGVDGLALGLALLNEVEELLSHDRAGILNLLRAALGGDISSAVGTLDALITRRRPPGLDLLDSSLVQTVLSLANLLRLGEKLEGIGGLSRVAAVEGHSSDRRGGQGAGGEEEGGTSGLGGDREQLPRSSSGYSAHHLEGSIFNFQKSDRVCREREEGEEGVVV